MRKLSDLFGRKERAKVQGYLASVWGIASVVGPTLGFLGIVIVAVPMVVMVSLLPRGDRPVPSSTTAADVPAETAARQ